MAQETLLDRVVHKASKRGWLLKKQIVQTLHSAHNKSATKQSVFVAGVQRSGTNMMMDVLEQSYDTDVYHETDNRAFEDYEMRSRTVIHRLVNTSKASVVVVKALCELHEVRQLLDEFAPAKGIWIIRDFADVVNSHLALWTSMPPNLGLIVKDRNAAGWRGRGMSDTTHALVKKLYHPDISNASACALFWYFRNILFYEQGLDQDERVALVYYESLVTNPTEQFSRMFDFLGIQYSPRITNMVFATSVRKRSPRDIDPAIREICEVLAARFNALPPKQ